MKVNGNELRPGAVIEHDGSLWVAVKTQTVKPGKGPAYNQVELKNLIDGRKLNNRFGSDERSSRRIWRSAISSSSTRKATASSSWTTTPTSRSA